MAITFTLRQLSYAAAVADQLNFSRAAEACHVTQPSLSGQIQELESSLGVQLFERNRRRVVVTAAGAAVLKRARSILTASEELGEFTRSLEEPLSGALRLGVIPTIAPYVLPTAIGPLTKKHPRLKLYLREGQTSDLVRMLELGSLDVLLVALEAELGHATTLPLYSDSFLVALPRDHRLSSRKLLRLDDLRSESVLLLDDGHCLRDQAIQLCNETGGIRLADFRAGSLPTLIRMVASGLGVTLLPNMSVEAEVAARELCVLPLREKAKRTIGMAWRPSSAREKEFNLLAQFFLPSQSDHQNL
jgi:LysR family transcriptional regulator, hydrogen peroxide-inducible genes activator